MDKKQFLDYVIEECRRISITSVISSRMTLRRSGRYQKGLCPFHNDRTIGSFVVTESIGIWKCFSCGAGGDTIKFVALFENINYIEAAFKLGLEYSIISVTEYQEYYEKRRYTKAQVTKIERKYEELDKDKFKSNIADEETLNKVFKVFTECCTLIDEHKELLTNKRCLSEEEIVEGGYFSFPTRSILNKFCKRIREEFKDQGGEQILGRIPGFYKDLKANRYTFVKHKGLGIPITNANGNIVGIQIRHDEVDEAKGGRYVWFSSSFADFYDDCDEGTSSGSPIDVIYPKKFINPNMVTITITEGRFKAQQITKNTGSISISVQGVGTWKGIWKEIKAIRNSEKMKELAPNGFKIFCIYVAFDADMNYKYQVFTQARKMADYLEQEDKDGEKEEGYIVYYLNWDDALGKGADDIYLSGYGKEIKKYDKIEWDKTYDFMIKELLEKEDYMEIKDVPEEVIRKYFLEHMKKLSSIEKGQIAQRHLEILNAKKAV